MEAAFVMLPIFAIIFGLIDFSLAIFIRNTLMHAVREGVRFGVTGRLLAGETGHDNSIKAVVRQQAMGFMNRNDQMSCLSIQYYDPRTGQIATGATSNRAGNILELSITNYPWTWVAPVFRHSATLSFNAQSSDLMEAQPTGPPVR